MKNRIILLGAVVLVITISVIFIWFDKDEMTTSSEINKIEVDKIKLLMTKDEVERLYGMGPDKTVGCFGCEMNFIYPALKLSGRYSETLDRIQKNGEIDWLKSPKVKQITTANEHLSILGVRIGDSLEYARTILEANGYRLQSKQDERLFGYYYKDNLYIRLWTDSEINLSNKDRNDLGEDEQAIQSITVEIRVKKDEEIIY
ncbi:hypothetical protein [Cohnella caldifontis]|uniref:hypothetical protein n=1 Tax=Cohnella caldifontis TaxID=3027471 RepID=UPI0023EB56B3|nr:hypothetical protein [Cohnella sp. YIM B05605]